MPDGSGHHWETAEKTITPAEAVAAILARSDLDLISQPHLTHFTDRVRTAIQAAQNAPVKPQPVTAIAADPDRKEFWIPGC